MISIVICSINPTYATQIRRNIEDTIGVPYQLLLVDNRGTNKGICKVYNEAAQKATYPYLCFIHEDVAIHTANWGAILVALLQNTDIGLVGISGSIYKSQYPAVWSACDADLYRTNSLQHFKGVASPVAVYHNPLSERYSQVAVVDGVFLAVSKTLWQQLPFNEAELTGFHGYDLDYSLQMKQQGRQVVVCYDIVIEHFSEGTLSNEWLQAYQKLHQRWNHLLPLQIGPIDKQITAKSNYLSIQTILKVALSHKGNKLLVIYYFCMAIAFYGKWNKGLFFKSIVKYMCK